MDLVLIGVAVVAGVATFLSPCVLPVLPVVLAASANGGRRRPLGIAIGLAVAFVIFTLTASRLLTALGLPQDLLRNLAVAMLALVGIALLVPAVATQVGRLYHPLAAAAGARLNDGDGFWSGVGLGAVLSLVWTPCAGPILAAVTVLSAESRVSLELVAVTAAYALGATVPLFVLALLGNRAAAPLAGVRRGGPMLRRAAGAVLLATAVLFTTDIPTQLAAGAPAYVSSLQHLERSHAAASDLRDLTRSSHNSPAAVAAGQTPDHLKNYGPAPDFTDITRWINTPGSRPLSLASLHGKVVLVDFWTYSCVNCIRTLPYLKQWYARYARDGLVIVGVHTPEFAFEHVIGNVEQAVSEHGIRYPVAVDDGYGTWNAWGNQYWPADYLIDRNGDVRDAHFGEGGYGQTEDDIRTLLGEPTTAALSRPAGALTPSSTIGTPETYLGTYRAAAYHQQLRAGRDAAYSAPARVAPNQVALAGHWDVEQHQIVSGHGARLLFRYTAPRIYLVAAPPAGGSARLHVRVDGRRLPDVTVPRDDLYQLAHLAGSGPHLLRLDLPPGTTLYSFTFG
jgi:cytochrome c biogenesis protein CcdA/thiol-disulfide isomerase/thioredoxin